MSAHFIMQQTLDVIAQFNRDGSIIPLKIRLYDEDGELQSYVIKAVRERYVNSATAPAIEEALMAEYLFETYEIPQIRFSFDRHNKSEMLYLYKLATTKSNTKLSLGERIEKLLGKTISISPNFIER